MHQNKNKIVTLVVTSFLLLLVTACAEMDSHSSISRFQKSENVYRASLRWGEWDNVFQLIKPNPDNTSSKLKPPSEDYLEYLNTIKVDNIQVLKTGITEKNKTGESLFLIEFQYDSSLKVRKIRHKVDWWYDDASNTWFTGTPLPKEFDMPKTKTIKLSPYQNR